MCRGTLFQRVYGKHGKRAIKNLDVFTITFFIPNSRKAELLHRNKENGIFLMESKQRCDIIFE